MNYARRRLLEKVIVAYALGDRHALDGCVELKLSAAAAVLLGITLEMPAGEMVLDEFFAQVEVDLAAAARSSATLRREFRSRWERDLGDHAAGETARRGVLELAREITQITSSDFAAVGPVRSAVLELGGTFRQRDVAA